jgi:hypothetical protein
MSTISLKAGPFLTLPSQFKGLITIFQGNVVNSAQHPRPKYRLSFKRIWNITSAIMGFLPNLYFVLNPWWTVLQMTSIPKSLITILNGPP